MENLDNDFILIYLIKCKQQLRFLLLIYTISYKDRCSNFILQNRAACRSEYDFLKTIRKEFMESSISQIRAILRAETFCYLSQALCISEFKTNVSCKFMVIYYKYHIEIFNEVFIVLCCIY